MKDYNEQYYNFIIDQIKDLKYAYSDLCDQLISTSIHYAIYPVNEKEFRHAFEWAVANVFNDGCEVEVV
jgi:hypothetical protein